MRNVTNISVRGDFQATTNDLLVFLNVAELRFRHMSCVFYAYSQGDPKVSRYHFTVSSLLKLFVMVKFLLQS